MRLRYLSLVVKLSFAVCISGATSATATPIEPVETAAAFLKHQLQAGKDADFTARCAAFTTGKGNDATAANACNTMDGSDFVSLIGDPGIAARLSPRGFALAGLVVEGDVDLRWASIRANIDCSKCVFKGPLRLDEAVLDHDLVLRRSTLLSGFQGPAMQVKGRLAFEGVEISGGRLDLSSAKLSDTLDLVATSLAADSILDLTNTTLGRVRLASSNLRAGMKADDAELSGLFVIDGSSVLGLGLVARGLTVSSIVKISGKSMLTKLDFDTARVTFGLAIDGGVRVGAGGIDLRNAEVGGSTMLAGTVVEASVVADGANFSKGLEIRGATVSGKISLHRAAVGGDFSLKQTKCAELTAQKMHVSGSLYLYDDQIMLGVDLKGTSIGADAEIHRSVIGKDLELNQVDVSKRFDIEEATNVQGVTRLVGTSVGGDLCIGNDPPTKDSRVTFGETDFGLARIGSSVFVHDANFRKPPQMVGSEIKSHLDISGAELPGLDLTRASIGGDFRLASRDEPHAPAHWASDAKLVLKNAHAGVIQNENEQPSGAAWPAAVDIEGFTFDHFAHDPSVEWLDQHWLSNSAEFQPASYARLAKYFDDEGRREQDEDVMFAEKTRETRQAWNHCSTLQLASCAHAAGLMALRALIGYGIGNRLFWALYWALGLTIVGALVLRQTRDEQQQRVLWGGAGKGRLWCVGASISHLLPLVELNKEFKDFFDDPERRRLAPWQLIYFAIHAIMGYVLGSFVVAAITGLTQVR